MCGVLSLFDQVTLAKVNIDKVGEIAVQLCVSSIPAVFAFYKKEKLSKYVVIGSFCSEETHECADF